MAIFIPFDITCSSGSCKCFQIVHGSLMKAMCLPNRGRCPPESTSAPRVILVINVNISLVGLILSSSIFKISSTMEWHGLEDVEPLQDAEDIGLAQAQSSGLYILF